MNLKIAALSSESVNQNEKKSEMFFRFILWKYENFGAKENVSSGLVSLKNIPYYLVLVYNSGYKFDYNL